MSFYNFRSCHLHLNSVHTSQCGRTDRDIFCPKSPSWFSIIAPWPFRLTTYFSAWTFPLHSLLFPCHIQSMITKGRELVTCWSFKPRWLIWSWNIVALKGLSQRRGFMLRAWCTSTRRWLNRFEHSACPRIKHQWLISFQLKISR